MICFVLAFADTLNCHVSIKQNGSAIHIFQVLRIEILNIFNFLLLFHSYSSIVWNCQV